MKSKCTISGCRFLLDEVLMCGFLLYINNGYLQFTFPITSDMPRTFGWGRGVAAEIYRKATKFPREK